MSTTLAPPWSPDQVAHPTVEGLDVMIAQQQLITGDEAVAILHAWPGAGTDDIASQLQRRRVRRSGMERYLAGCGADFYVSKHLGQDVDLVNYVVRHARWPWAVSRLAALRHDGKHLRGMVIALGWEWSGLSPDELVDLAITRTAWDMAITGLRHMDVVYLTARPGRGPTWNIVPVSRTGRSRGDDLALDDVKAWRWAHCIGADAPPVPQPRAAGPIRRATSEEEALLRELDQTGRNLYAARRRHEEVRTRLEASMGDARGLIGRGYKALSTVELHSDDIDVEALQTDHPDVYADVRRRARSKRRRTLKTFVTGGPRG